MTHLKKSLLACLLLFCLVGPSVKAAPASLGDGGVIYLPLVLNGCAECIFVNSASGSDANSGASPASPWKTIQKAANAVTPGTTVYVMAGTYTERVRVTRSGAENAPVIFTALGQVTLRGFTINASYIQVTGFDITDTPDDWQDGWGIFARGSYNRIERNYVYDATRGGIVLWANAGQEDVVHDNQVIGNRLYHNATAGVIVQGRNNLIEGNEIWRTIQYHPKWVNPPSNVDADGMRFFGSGHVIRRNFIHDITYADPENVNPHIDCFQTWGSANYEVGHDLIIEQNFCKNLESQAVTENGKGFRIQGSYNLTIRNNLILAFVLFDIDDAHDIIVVHNTFSNTPYVTTTGSPSGIMVNNPTRLTVENNIFYNVGVNERPYLFLTGTASEVNAGYNLVYMSSGKNPGGSPYPNDLWQVNSLFVNPGAFDFHLRADSPAIDAGLDLGIPTDYDGVARPQGTGYDIGAFEIQKP
jgi:hypothetical protein